MIAFVHIPKTAGSTVKSILRNSFCLSYCDIKPHGKASTITSADVEFAKRHFRFGLDCVGGHGLIGTSLRIPDLPCFTFLRDPIKRSASAYQHYLIGRRRKSNPNQTLREYFQQHSFHCNQQVQQIVGKPDLELAKRELEQHYFFVGLTERFDESLDILTKLSPYPIDPQYDVLNQARDDSIKKELLSDSASRSLLEEYNQLDQQLYDWTREVLFPRLKEAAESQTPKLARHSQLTRRLRIRTSRSYNLALYRSRVQRESRATKRSFLNRLIQKSRRSASLLRR